MKPRFLLFVAAFALVAGCKLNNASSQPAATADNAPAQTSANPDEAPADDSTPMSSRGAEDAASKARRADARKSLGL